ncbi:MAG: hypothetical protein QW622_01525 [Candidatus Pacearchaeota archaeon]
MLELLRLKRKDYNSFIENFVKNLEKLGNKNLSFLVFGSYLNKKRFVPGRSDIDGILVFPDKFIIDKSFLSEVAHIFTSVKKKIPLDLKVFDIELLIDGRFNVYEPSFREVIDSGKIFFGPDYRNKFHYTLPLLNGQARLRYTLSESRKSLLYYRHGKIESIFEHFYQTLHFVKRAPQNLLCMLGENYNWETAYEKIKQRNEFNFSYKTLETLNKIKHLMCDPKRLNKLCQNKEQVIKLWEDAVTCFEELIKNYVLSHSKAIPKY